MYEILGPQTVRRLVDGAYVPLDPGNRDYQAFADWLALHPEAGALPLPDPVIIQEPADAPAPPEEPAP
jgi:hypothetical protein